MRQSFFQPLRFKIIFYVFWFSMAEVHTIVLSQYGFTTRMAFIDSAVSNILLAATTVVIAKTLQYYLPQKNRYVYISALVVVLSLIWLFTSRAIIMQFAPPASDYNSFFSTSFSIRATFGFLINGCMALMSLLWFTNHDQKETDLRTAETEKLARDAELFNLRQQLQPHFLFNSLNSINALITIQPQKAREMIQQLAEFLRGTLKKEEQQMVTLQDELQHLELYLNIEKVRFGHRLKTHIETSDEAQQAKIPVMLLQPVVENAIKFGLYDTTGDIVITIQSTLQSGYLEVSISNPYDAETSLPQQGSGFGLPSIQRRLFLLYARNDLLQTSGINQQFTTLIKIPQQI